MADQYDIIVCGDSFCCASDLDLKMVGKRAHFSQILEDRWNYRVLNLAHGAVSNICILWQMRESAKLSPKTVIYNRTFEGRMDIMLNDKFNRARGLKNWGYWEKNQTSYLTPYTSRFGDDSNPSVVSTVYQGLRDNHQIPLNEDHLIAAEKYLLHFFNWDMLNEISNWSFAYWHDRLRQQGIQPLPFRHELVGKIAWDFSSIHTNYDSPFHTDRSTQQKVAENIHRLISESADLSDIAY